MGRVSLLTLHFTAISENTQLLVKCRITIVVGGTSPKTTLKASAEAVLVQEGGQMDPMMDSGHLGGRSVGLRRVGGHLQHGRLQFCLCKASPLVQGEP